MANENAVAQVLQYLKDKGEIGVAGVGGFADAALFGLLSNKLDSFKELQKEHPLAYGTGELASVFIPATGILKAGMVAKKGVSAVNAIKQLLQVAKTAHPQDVKKIVDLAKSVRSTKGIGDSLVKGTLKTAAAPTAFLNELGEVAGKKAVQFASPLTQNKIAQGAIGGAANALTQAGGQGAVRGLLGDRDISNQSTADAAIGAIAGGGGLGALSPALMKTGRAIYSHPALENATATLRGDIDVIKQLMNKGVWGGREKFLEFGEKEKAKYGNIVDELMNPLRAMEEGEKTKGLFGEDISIPGKSLSSPQDFWHPFLQRAEERALVPGAGDTVKLPANPTFGYDYSVRVPREHARVMAAHADPLEMNPKFQGMAGDLRISDVEQATRNINKQLFDKKKAFFSTGKEAKDTPYQAMEDFKQASDEWLEGLVQKYHGQEGIDKLRQADKSYALGSSVERALNKGVGRANVSGVQNVPKSAMAYGVARVAQKDLVPLGASSLVALSDVGTTSMAPRTGVGLGIYKAGASDKAKQLAGRAAESKTREKKKTKEQKMKDELLEGFEVEDSELKKELLEGFEE